jgi:RNA polymerase primary sigma factor
MNTLESYEVEAEAPNAPYLLDSRDDDLPVAHIAITGATADSLRDYLRQIAKLPKLAPGEDAALAKQTEAGVLAEEALNQFKPASDPEYARDLLDIARLGQRAKGLLIDSHMRQVVQTARKNQGQGLTLIDLIQEGTIGLVRAVEKFDYRQGYPFSSYCWFWIQQAMARAIHDQGHTIRVPVHMGEQINKMKRMQANLLVRLEREATEEELAEALGVTVKNIVEWKAISLEPVSLSEPMNLKGDTLGDTLEDEFSDELEEHAAANQLREILEKILGQLSEREAIVIRRRFGLDGLPPMTLEQIGEDMGVTRERIRQIEAKTMSKLQHPSFAQALKDFLED